MYISGSHHLHLSKMEAQSYLLDYRQINMLWKYLAKKLFVTDALITINTGDGTKMWNRRVPHKSY